MDHHVLIDNLVYLTDKRFISHHLPYVQTNVLIGRAGGLYFLLKKILKSICQ